MKLNRTVMALASLAMMSGLTGVAGAQALDKTDLAPLTPAMISPDLAGQGRLVFASRTQDTGEILDTGTTQLTFIFRNTGSGPLTITQVKPACGCTVPELAKKTYMPGEQGTLNVTFDPKGKNGAIARNITIFTDSDSTPNTAIVIRALVKPVVIAEPQVMAFEALEKGVGSTKEIKVYGRIDDFKVTRATIDDTDTFSIEVVDGGMVEKNGETLRLQIIRVTVKKEAKPDNHRAQITVRTNDERKSIFSLATVARIMGDLTVNPIRVTMGRIAVGDEFEKEFHITSKTGKAFTIENAYANTVALDATYEFSPVDPEARNDWIIKIKGTVTGAASRFNTQLHVVTDVADEEELTVQMYGQLLKQ